MKQNPLIALLITGLLLPLYAQDSTGVYCGFPKPGSTPEKFAPGFICTGEIEFSGTFTPDLTEYYFTRRGTASTSLARIMMTQKTDSGWTAPEVASFASSYFEFEPFITPDGGRLYYGSRRSPGSGIPAGTLQQWYVDREVGGWSEPVVMGEPLYSTMAMSACVAADRTFYYTSYDGIYCCEWGSSGYTTAQKLGAEINYMPLTAHSYVAPDKSYMIFDAQPRGTGLSDLYVSYGKPDGNWTRAKFLDETINSGSSQSIASVSPDGQCLFFTREGDIYWMDAAVIDQMKHIPAVDCSERSGEAPLTAAFTTDLSTVPETLTSFAWDFDGDGTVDSDDANPTFVYTQPGCYPVTLTVTTAGDTASKVLTDYVNVQSSTPVSSERGGTLDFQLMQNYPNPFNPVTSVQYSVKTRALVKICIVDCTGREVAVPVDKVCPPGTYRFDFQAADLPSGVYFCRMTSGAFSKTQKMMLLK